jgi:hypothetical protein
VCSSDLNADQIDIVTMGDKYREIKFIDIESMSNEKKCDYIYNEKIPWVEIDNKCNFAGI